MRRKGPRPLERRSGLGARRNRSPSDHGLRPSPRSRERFSARRCLAHGCQRELGQLDVSKELAGRPEALFSARRRLWFARQRIARASALETITFGRLQSNVVRSNAVSFPQFGTDRRLTVSLRRLTPPAGGRQAIEPTAHTLGRPIPARSGRCRSTLRPSSLLCRPEYGPRPSHSHDNGRARFGAGTRPR